LHLPWVAGEEDLAPCQLNFDDYGCFQEDVAYTSFLPEHYNDGCMGDASMSLALDFTELAHENFQERNEHECFQEDTYDDDNSFDRTDSNEVFKPSSPKPVVIDSVSSTTESDAKSDKECRSRTFPFGEIPSPTRNRAKRQLMAELEKAAAEESSSLAEPSDKPDLQKEETSEKVAEEAQVLETEKDQCSQEEKRQREAMDKMCIDAFLECVKEKAWAERGGHEPIKGTNLYVKHMRPCRRPGTSVDVKDSSFRYLGPFLDFLETEGLLCLRPGLTDPVVTKINFNACRRYRGAPTSDSTPRPKLSLTQIPLSLRPKA